MSHHVPHCFFCFWLPFRKSNMARETPPHLYMKECSKSSVKIPSKEVYLRYPSGTLTIAIENGPFIVSFPIKNGYFSYSYVSLPKGSIIPKRIINPTRALDTAQMMIFPLKLKCPRHVQTENPQLFPSLRPRSSSITQLQLGPYEVGFGWCWFTLW